MDHNKVNGKKLNDKDLGNVTGGAGDYEKGEIDTRKDLYENIILGATPQEHNVMLNDASEK